MLLKNQFGFKPDIGITINTLCSSTKFIYGQLENSEKVIAIFIDFTKAHDTVDHEVLINILPNFGIDGESLSSFFTYLKEQDTKGLNK